MNTETTTTTTKRTVIEVTERLRRNGRGRVTNNYGERVITDMITVDAWGIPQTLGYATVNGRRRMVGFNPTLPRTQQVASVLTSSALTVFGEMYQAAQAK